MENSTVTIITTFNRLDKLKETIERVQNQSADNTIVIVDNASKQDTADYLHELDKTNQIHWLRLKKNIGGAGGFSAGLQYAYETFKDASSFWIMDDDTYPEPNTLARLLEFSQHEPDFGFLCSTVLWTDGSPSVMNYPVLDPDWLSGAKWGGIKVTSASFVSVLVSRQAVKKVGLPIAEFFIWGDDAEYTRRVSNIMPSYLVFNSQVTHQIATNQGVNIFSTDPGRIDRYFYSFRNRFWVAKQQGARGVLFEIARNVYLSGKIFFGQPDHKSQRIHIIWKGFFAGIHFNPAIQRV